MWSSTVPGLITILVSSAPQRRGSGSSNSQDSPHPELSGLAACLNGGEDSALGNVGVVLLSSWQAEGRTPGIFSAGPGAVWYRHLGSGGEYCVQNSVLDAGVFGRGVGGAPASCGHSGAEANPPWTVLPFRDNLGRQLRPGAYLLLGEGTSETQVELGAGSLKLD